MTAIAFVSGYRELAQRVSGGLGVTLYWNPANDATWVRIEQPATEETLEFEVRSDQALDAFYHPFVHLPPVGEHTPFHDGSYV